MYKRSPVDVDRVYGGRAELGDLKVLLLPVLLVLELSFGVGDKAPTLPHTDKVCCVALQMEQVCLLMVRADPGLTEVDDVSLLDGRVNLEVSQVGLQPGNVEGSHLNLAIGDLVPLSRVLIQ